MGATRVLVVAAVLVTAVIRTLSRRRRQRRIELTDDLRYRVPVGQDPAAVVAKVRVSGFQATTENSAGYPEVVVTCDPASDRERVRQLISESALNMEDDAAASEPVGFVDEQPTAPA